jgi:hypothetical protein
VWYGCPRRILLAASDRFMGFLTYENTPPFFFRQSTTFDNTSSTKIDEEQIKEQLGIKVVQ